MQGGVRIRFPSYGPHPIRGRQPSARVDGVWAGRVTQALSPPYLTIMHAPAMSASNRSHPPGPQLPAPVITIIGIGIGITIDVDIVTAIDIDIDTVMAKQSSASIEQLFSSLHVSPAPPLTPPPRPMTLTT